MGALSAIGNYTRRYIRKCVESYVCAKHELRLALTDSATRFRAARANRLLVPTVRGEFNGDRMALLVTSGPHPPKCIDNLIRLLGDQGCPVLLVVNGGLSPTRASLLPSNVWCVLERPNCGRDFAAYQAGALYLQQQKIVPRKLLLANDSVYYDGARAPGMLRRAFDCEGDFVGATENYEPSYHVSSYLIAVSDIIQRSPAWIAFWKNYKPTSSRPKVIRYGELGLSAAIIRAGFRPHILYSVCDIAPIVREWGVEDVAARFNCLPSEFRADFLQLDSGGSPGGGRDNISSVVHRMRLSALFDSMLNRMEGRSQIHWAGLLMVEYLKIGVIKKDFVFRGLYGLNEFIQAVTQIGYPDVPEVVAETRSRGLPPALRGQRKILFDRGYI